MIDSSRFGVVWAGVFIGLLSNVERSPAANPDHIQRLLKTNQCPMCDLSNANLQEANLFGANLVNANLQGANLSGANLGSANLTDADLTGATLKRAYLYQAVLENTNFALADLSGAYLKSAALDNTNFARAELQGINLSRTNLVGIQLKGSNLSGANLSGAIFSGVRSLTGNRELQSFWNSFSAGSIAQSSCFNRGDRRLSTRQANGFELAFADLSGSQLKNANLQNAILFNANLSKADLTGANLTGANLRCSNLKNTRLDNANLKNALLDQALLEGASLKGTQNANLNGTLQSEADAQASSRQIEAKQYVSAMSSSQRAYFLKNKRFAANIEDLGLGIKSETEHYSYRIFLYRDPTKAAMLAGMPKKNGFNTYLGLVNAVGKDAQIDQASTRILLCESNESKPLLPQIPTPISETGTQALSCPAGFKPILR